MTNTAMRKTFSKKEQRLDVQAWTKLEGVRVEIVGGAGMKEAVELQSNYSFEQLCRIYGKADIWGVVDSI